MKYTALICFIICLFAGYGCTATKSVPMITESEDQRLLELSKSRKDKKNNERIVIGIPFVKDEEAEKYADELIDFLLMTDYVKEANYTHLLSNNPDLIVTQIAPYEEKSFMDTISLPFYYLTLGVIPRYTRLNWGYSFNLKPIAGQEEDKFIIGCSTYGFSGWLCLLINWFPGMGPYSINGEYYPFEIKCRLILQLQDARKDILNLVPNRKNP